MVLRLSSNRSYPRLEAVRHKRTLCHTLRTVGIFVSGRRRQLRAGRNHHRLQQRTGLRDERLRAQASLAAQTTDERAAWVQM